MRYIEEDHGYDTPCWIWQLRGRSWNGYGEVRVNGRTKRVHRHYYEQAKGKIPDGLQLDHLCRVRDCVNPDHMEVVTGAENVRRGSLATLTHKEVDMIRELLAGGWAQTAIGEAFGVTQSTVSRINTGWTWASE